MGIFSWLKKKPQVIEIRNFSQILRFSFDYPIFLGWDVGTSEITEDESGFEVTCIIPIIPLKETNVFIKPVLKVIKSERIVNVDTTKFLKNPNNISYTYSKTFDNKVIITFYSEEFVVEIYPLFYEEQGYSEKIFSEKVIESFKWVY